MSSNITHGNSPLRMIKNIANIDDFVAFKLDIDTPTVEIPTVLNLLKDSVLQNLVDEFFFELHFQCEVTGHWWNGHDIPSNYMGISLRRESAMSIFRDLREKGIRAHFWP